MDIQFIRSDSPLSLVLQVRCTNQMRTYRRDEGPLTGQTLLHLVFAGELVQLRQPLSDAVAFPEVLSVMEGNGEVFKYVGL
jgi:hypothetical protein